MHKLKILILKVYEFIVLVFLLNRFDVFMSYHNSYYFNHDVLFFDIGLLFILLIIIYSYLKRIYLIAEMNILLVLSQFIFIFYMAIDRGVRYEDLFLVNWGIYNFFLLMFFSIINLVVSYLNFEQFKVIKYVSVILVFVGSFMFVLNMGYFADEYANLAKTGLDMGFSWNLLIFSLLNFYQLFESNKIGIK